MSLPPGLDLRVSTAQIREALGDVDLTPADPWVWVMYYHPDAAGTREALLIAAGHIVGQARPKLLSFATPHAWEERLRGFRFELLGSSITQQELEAEPCPFWGLHVPNPGDYDLFDAAGLLRVAVRRWRAIHVEANVFAQVDWRPGWTKEVPSFGGVRVGDANDTTRANLGLAILQHQLDEARRPGLPAVSDRDAFEEAVAFGLAWLEDHPDKEPRDFGDQEFATARCTRVDAVRKWMTAKHFGIRQVRPLPYFAATGGADTWRYPVRRGATAVRRIHVPLPDEQTRRALVNVAEREFRDPRDQAAFYIKEGLVRAGVLTDEHSAAPTTISREPEAVAR